MFVAVHGLYDHDRDFYITGPFDTKEAAAQWLARDIAGYWDSDELGLFDDDGNLLWSVEAVMERFRDRQEWDQIAVVRKLSDPNYGA